MREHPIPQDVVGYKFHIVGNMTLKQFAEIAVGVVIGVIIYNTNLLPLIKWTLIIMSASFGAMLAFVPIEERPLDHWVTTFFKRLYSPTKFYWKKETDVPFAFTHKKREITKEEESFEIDLTPARRQRIKEYLNSVNVIKNDDPLDDADQQRMQEILASYENVEVKKVEAKPQKIKPNLTPKVRNLSRRRTISSSEMENVVFQQQKKSIQHQNQKTKENKALSEAPKLETPAVEVEMPNKQPFQMPKEEVFTSDELPFPKRPETPNTLVGMVLTPDNKLVDQAVVQIKNSQGQPIQALKTNLLGQFSLSTALPNGTYVVSVEKKGFSFPEQSIALSGEIVSPLEIRST
jgi:hypothetical protein